VFNRYNRWSKRGLWQDIFAALANCEPQLASAAMIDSTAVPAHRAASGAKGERGQAIGRSRGGRTTKIRALIAIGMKTPLTAMASRLLPIGKDVFEGFGNAVLREPELAFPWMKNGQLDNTRPDALSHAFPDCDGR
jgi:hypothetical protein